MNVVENAQVWLIDLTIETIFLKTVEQKGLFDEIKENPNFRSFSIFIDKCS